MFKFSDTTLSITAIWKSAFELYKITIFRIWYLALAMMMVILSGNIFFPAKTGVTSADMHSVIQVFSHQSIAVVIYSSVTGLLSIFLIAVILHRMVRLVVNPDLDVTDSIQHVLSRYLILVISMIVVYISTMAGVILLIIPGIFVDVLLMFNMPLILFDDDGWISAIKKSAKLVWGNWWETFSVVLIPRLAIVIVKYFIAGVTAFSPWAYFVLASVTLAFLNPFIDAVILVLFNNLKLCHGDQPLVVAHITED